MGLEVLEQWWIAPSDLEMTQQIGEGVQGLVFIGSWKGTPVAIKQSKPLSEYALSTLRSYSLEIQFLMNLRPHPNTVQLFGLCPNEKTGQVSVVMEYCQHGMQFASWLVLFERLTTPQALWSRF